jgi:hypothetical protein
MRFYIVGLNIREAQGYAMRCKPEHKGHQVRVMSVESIKGGALEGLGGENVEVVILPRAWIHRDASVALGEVVKRLELRGVRVTTPEED